MFCLVSIASVHIYLTARALTLAHLHECRDNDENRPDNADRAAGEDLKRPEQECEREEHGQERNHLVVRTAAHLAAAHSHLILHVHHLIHKSLKCG